MSADLIVVGGSSLAGEPLEVVVSGGVITDVGARVASEARTVIDASGLTLIAGGVDPHVHFNEPGPRAEWEGWETGSAAAAVGGVCTVVEMPLNAHPPTVDADAFDLKVACASGRSYVDFALWGGVVPGNREQLAPLAARGVVGFKAFMSASGVDDFLASDDLTLYEAMSEIAELGLPLALHAESDTITAALAARARSNGRLAVRDYLDSRPPVAESEAISRALELAAVTGCRLHIVHVSTARGVRLVAGARGAGVDVTCEVTPHNLLLTDEDAVGLGAIAKCAPPLRSRAQTEALWQLLHDGEIDWVASDHSPSSPELKRGEDAFATWGGISGVQTLLELMLSEGRYRLRAERLREAIGGAGGARGGGVGGGGPPPSPLAHPEGPSASRRRRRPHAHRARLTTPALGERAALPPSPERLGGTRADRPRAPHAPARGDDIPRWTADRRAERPPAHTHQKPLRRKDAEPPCRKT